MWLPYFTYTRQHNEHNTEQQQQYLTSIINKKNKATYTQTHVGEQQHCFYFFMFFSRLKFKEKSLISGKRLA